jgi:hypothetical protein
MPINLSQSAVPFGPFALEKNRQLAALNTKLFDLVVDNTSGTDCYVQLWDVAAVGDIGGANADAAPDFEELVPNGSFLPFSWDGGYQFHRGLYVRCVTTLGGSTAIAGDTAKFSGRQLTPWPLSAGAQ